MDKESQYLISKDNGKLQIPYEEYVSLVEKAEEAKRIDAVKNKVLTDLEAFLGGKPEEVAAERKADQSERAVLDAVERAEIGELTETAETLKTDAPAAEKSAAAEKPAAGNARTEAAHIEIPPIKKEIEEHFNKLDDSGRLLNVFRQYYTCLNDSCGSTVRVTMKDGFCSLWNYDEWEEFAFVDIFEGNLRFSVDPRYTGALTALNICEVPRLLSSRRKLVCVQMDDLNTTLLNVLAKAFEEVGITAS